MTTVCMRCLLVKSVANGFAKQHSSRVGDMLLQNGGRQQTPAYLLSDLKPGHSIPGPAIIIDKISTVLVEPQCTAYLTAAGDIRVEVGDTQDGTDLSTDKCDPIQLAIFSHRYCWTLLKIDLQTNFCRQCSLHMMRHVIGRNAAVKNTLQQHHITLGSGGQSSSMRKTRIHHHD